MYLLERSLKQIEALRRRASICFKLEFNGFIVYARVYSTKNYQNRTSFSITVAMVFESVFIRKLVGCQFADESENSVLSALFESEESHICYNACV